MHKYPAKSSRVDGCGKYFDDHFDGLWTVESQTRDQVRMEA